MLSTHPVATVQGLIPNSYWAYAQRPLSHASKPQNLIAGRNSTPAWHYATNFNHAISTSAELDFYTG
jgi:hypothetical protein